MKKGSGVRASWQESVGVFILCLASLFAVAKIQYLRAAEACDAYPHVGRHNIVGVIKACAHASYSPFAETAERIPRLTALSNLLIRIRNTAVLPYVLSDLIVAQPGNADNHFARGFLRVSRGQYADAVYDLDEALRIGFSNTHRVGLAHVYRGVANYKLGNRIDAIADNVAALVMLHPRSPEAAAARATLEWIQRH